MSRHDWPSVALRPLLFLLFAVGVAWFLMIAPARGEPAPGPSIRLNPPGERRAAFEVIGLTRRVADALATGAIGPDPDRWAALFAVYTVPSEVPATGDQPPVLGTYRVVAGVLRFQPRFPLEPGQVYRARFDPTKLPAERGATDVQAVIEAEFALPRKPARPTTVVTAVYPTRDLLPENLLKLYLQFSAPMSRGAAYGHIHLRDANGKDPVFPFLELGEELWDPSGRRLTLLFDPGRIKTGLKPREELGPILQPGGSYTLVIDRDWLDAEGQPLKSGYRKTFRAGPSDNTPPDPSTWTIQGPDAGTRDPLVLTFPEPLDRALLARLITVYDAAGHPVPGAVAVEDGETRWRLTPERPWEAGGYSISVNTELEDLAGNSIGRLFEVDVFKTVERQPKAETVALPFRIVPPSR